MESIPSMVDTCPRDGLSWLAAGVLSLSVAIDGGRRRSFPSLHDRRQMFLPDLA